MKENNQNTCPLIIDRDSNQENVQLLEKVTLRLPQNENEVKLYDESWLQNLLFRYPSILPVEELESAFFPLYPVCRELRTPAGFLDNLYVSENGSLTLVECKLWRNPEARREVIAQVLDYAKEFAQWSYEDLTNFIQKATGKKGNVLFDTVADIVEETDESIFVDSVTRNLKRGRFLVLIVGDGIREGVQNISNFLQRHAGLDFTFGLVELGIYKIPREKRYIVQPRVLAKTYTVERAVIRAEGGEVKIVSPNGPEPDHKTTGHRSTISEEQFFENIRDELGVEVGKELFSFVQELSNLDITPVYGSSSLNLRWYPESNLKMNFGSIHKSGKLDTAPSNWVPDSLGKIHLGHDYQKSLAAIIRGAYVREHERPTRWVVFKDEKAIQINEVLPVKNSWIEIIKKTQEQMSKALSS